MPVTEYYKLAEMYKQMDQVTSIAFIVAAVFLTAYWVVIRQHRKWLIYLLSALTISTFTMAMLMFLLIILETT